MKTLLFYFLLVQITWCNEFLSTLELYEQSENWPQFASLTENFENENLKIERGTQGVLIRLLDNGNSALLDFGRKGLHFVATKDTDIIVEAQKLKQGLAEKKHPNLIALLQTRLIAVKGDKARRFTDKDACNTDFFVCVRFPNTVDAWKKVSEKMKDSKYKSAEFILFPDAPTSSDLEVFNLIKRHNIFDANYMYSFLSQDYMKILWYGLPEENELITIVKFDPNGKIWDYKSIQVKTSMLN